MIVYWSPSDAREAFSARQTCCCRAPGRICQRDVQKRSAKKHPLNRSFVCGAEGNRTRDILFVRRV